MTVHVLPVVPKVRTEPKVKYIQCVLTGHVITSRTVGLTNPFDGSWITEAVASHFNVSPDEIESIETEEYSDGLAIKGELVAFVEVN